MKKTSTIQRLGAVILALGLLAGCGGQAASSAEIAASSGSEPAPTAAAPASTPTPEASVREETSEQASTPEAAQASEDFTPMEYSFPLTEQTETLRYFATMSPNFTSYMDDYSTNASVQALEELTGVHIDYECYIPENAQTQFNLQAAAGSLPDILLGATEYYSGGMDTAVSDDILLNLADYLEDCPNYSRILELTPDMKNSLTTDSGNLIGFYPYTDPKIATPVSGSIFVRGDWLDQVGMEVPATYDQVHEVLTAFQQQLGIEHPMLVNSYLDDQAGSFASGYDIKAFFMTSPGIQVPFYVVDGQVECAIVEDDFVSYVTMLQDYMNEGLTMPGIESYTNEMSYQDLVISGQIGFFWGFGVRDMETLNSQIEDGYLVAVPAIRQTEDQTLHFTTAASYQVRYAVSLSATCSNVELACKWLDAHYTQEVSMLAMYGVEGVSYEMKDGTPHFTDMMTQPAEEGLTLTVQKALYCLAEADNIYYQTINTDLDVYTDAQVEALESINGGSMDGEYVYPTGASMTTEEDERYTALISDLSTYMAEHVLKFVTGEEDMGQYPDFVATLYEMGMQEAIDLKQAAYDRYMAR